MKKIIVIICLMLAGCSYTCMTGEDCAKTCYPRGVYLFLKENQQCFCNYNESSGDGGR